MVPRPPQRNRDAVSLDPAHPVKSMLRLVTGQPWQLVATLGLFVLKDVPVWVIPVSTSQIIDAVVSGAGVGQILLWAGIAIAAVLSNYPSSMGFVRLSSRIFRGAAARLREAVSARLQVLPLSFHQRTSPAVVQSKLVRDVENVETTLAGSLPASVSALGILVGATAMTAWLVPVFLPVYVVVVPIAATLLATGRRRLQASNEEFRREVEELSHAVGEMVSLNPITRAHGLEQVAHRRLVARANLVRDTGRRLDLHTGRFAVGSWVSYQTLGMVCLALAAIGSVTRFVPVTAGQIVLLSSYLAMLTNAIVSIFGLAPVITKGIESVRSLAEVLGSDEVENPGGTRQVGAVTGALAFDGVTLRFPGAARPALDGVTLSVAPGESVALVGASGAGKSTMLNLAVGLIRPDSGTVSIDGADLAGIDLGSYRRQVAVVPQEAVLFRGSVYDNVTYGLPEATPALVERALADANALDFVRALPQGWDTPVGERGATLSGGQRQRIAIARALIRDPRVLILDEATSALDTESERLIQASLAGLMAGRTTLIVAHRLSTVRHATRILVFDRGRIVEQGSHEELVAASGRYAALLAAQLR